MIDPRAIIDPAASLGNDVYVGPYSIIGPDVEIGDGTWIGPHVVINGPTRIGQHNKIFQFTSLGEAPQAKNYAGEATRLQIGDHNIIREFCTFNRGTAQGGEVTSIGNHNFIMAYTHIAHDCKVGNHVVFANNATLGGHVVVGDFTVFGGCSAVHQFCHVGAYAFVAGATSVVKDVPPYVLVSGHPAAVYGLNVVGLRRNGLNEITISALRKAYNIIYRQGLTLQQAMAELEQLLPEHREIQLFISALSDSSRGIVR